LEEFAIKLDNTQAKAGDIKLIIRNEGNMPHDFALSGEGLGEKTPMLQPGESATLEVRLQPGSYKYVCTVAGHAMLGMQGEFTVWQ
jgi:plastocyanin